MFCQKCGTEYEGNTCPNGCTVQKQKKPIYKKWWFWLIIGIVVVSVFSSSGDDTQTPSETNPATISKNDATPSPAETTTPVDPFYHVGDSINANGLTITYVKAEKHEESNQFLQPDDGYMYIKLYLSAENTSNVDRYLSSFEFTCYADGKKQESYYGGDKTLAGGTLSSGRKDEGYLYFSVPEDATEIEVEYETSFWTDQKAILKVELG